jgi:hypothetical protein
MLRFKVTISDTITYSRSITVTVEAADEDAAEAIGGNMTLTHRYPPECGPLYRVREWLDFDEDEIDNTPWEVQVEQA